MEILGNTKVCVQFFSSVKNSILMNIYWQLLDCFQGRPSPKANAFPLCFRFPLLFLNIFQTTWKISPVSTFFQTDLGFYPAKLLMTFFNFPPYFCRIDTFPPISKKLQFPLNFYNFPSILFLLCVFASFTCFLLPP